MCQGCSLLKCDDCSPFSFRRSSNYRAAWGERPQRSERSARSGLRLLPATAWPCSRLLILETSIITKPHCYERFQIRSFLFVFVINPPPWRVKYCTTPSGTYGFTVTLWLQGTSTEVWKQGHNVRCRESCSMLVHSGNSVCWLTWTKPAYSLVLENAKYFTITSWWFCMSWCYFDVRSCSRIKHQKYKTDVCLASPNTELAVSANVQSTTNILQTARSWKRYTSLYKIFTFLI